MLGITGRSNSVRQSPEELPQAPACRVGAAAGEPSVRALLRELAAGELVARRRAGRPSRRLSQADQVREELARDPSATGAEIARRVGCSQSLVAKVKAGER